MSIAQRPRTKISKRIEWAVSWRHAEHVLPGPYKSKPTPCEGHLDQTLSEHAARAKAEYLTRPDNPGNLDVILLQRRVITTNWLPPGAPLEEQK
jgi:hypothetical protein